MKLMMIVSSQMNKQIRLKFMLELTWSIISMQTVAIIGRHAWKGNIIGHNFIGFDNIINIFSRVEKQCK